MEMEKISVKAVIEMITRVFMCCGRTLPLMYFFRPKAEVHIKEERTRADGCSETIIEVKKDHFVGAGLLLTPAHVHPNEGFHFTGVGKTYEIIQGSCVVITWQPYPSVHFLSAGSRYTVMTGIPHAMVFPNCNLVEFETCVFKVVKPSGYPKAIWEPDAERLCKS